MSIKELLKAISKLDSGDEIVIDDLAKVEELITELTHQFNSKEVVLPQPDDLPVLEEDSEELSNADLVKFKRKYKIPELIKLAKANGVKGYSGKGETELIQLLHSEKVKL